MDVECVRESGPDWCQQNLRRRRWKPAPTRLAHATHIRTGDTGRQTAVSTDTRSIREVACKLDALHQPEDSVVSPWKKHLTTTRLPTCSLRYTAEAVGHFLAFTAFSEEHPQSLNTCFPQRPSFAVYLHAYEEGIQARTQVRACFCRPKKSRIRLNSWRHIFSQFCLWKMGINFVSIVSEKNTFGRQPTLP